MRVAQMLKDVLDAYFVLNPANAVPVYTEHSDAVDENHIAIYNLSERERTDDGLKDYFRDRLRVKITLKASKTIDDVLATVDDLLASIVGIHLTTEIIESSLIDNPSPLRLNGKQWFWSGTLRVSGCFP